MSTTTPATAQPITKGSDEERALWKTWASRNRLLDGNGNFIPRTVSDRRLVYRQNLAPQDTFTLSMIEKVVINTFHSTNSDVERWPESIRIKINSTGEDHGVAPFESWVGPPGLQKRIQATRVWTELVQFFVLEYHINNVTWPNDETIAIYGDQGYLPVMGLDLSESLGDDILDIVGGVDMWISMQDIDGGKAHILEFFLNIIMQKDPTPRNNPLLFWVAFLLQTEEFGNMPRFEFSGAKDELTMREKLEALIHYARVLVLHHASQSWLRSVSVSKAHQTKLLEALNRNNLAWLDNGLPRPADQQGDPADFVEPYWHSFMAYFEDLHGKWLVKGTNTAIGVILGLL